MQEKFSEGEKGKITSREMLHFFLNSAVRFLFGSPAPQEKYKVYFENNLLGKALQGKTLQYRYRVLDVRGQYSNMITFRKCRVISERI